MGYTYKAIIAGREYLTSEIHSCTCENSLMNKQLEVGNVAAGRFDITITPKADDIPEMSKVEFFMRDTGSTEWIRRGTYYVHNWTLDRERNRITLECYDAILSLDVPFTATYPTNMQLVVASIGIPLSPDTIIKPYEISYKDSRTKREVLQDIASAHAGNFTLTMDGYLRLVPIYEQLNEHDIARLATTYSKNKEQLVIQAVSMRRDDGTVFSAGTVTTGSRLYIHNANATQEMTNDIYAKVNGYIHNPFSATKAYIDPQFNLGDTVIIDDNKHVINAFRMTYSATVASDLSSPFSVGADFVGEITRELERTNEAVEAVVEEAVEAAVEAVQGMAPTIVTTELITNNLYADNGTIVNLTVDQLRTDYERARRYLNNDTETIFYLFIHNEQIGFWEAETDGTEETHFSNADGQLLYWYDIPGGSMTTEKVNAETGEDRDPVIVYVYDEINPGGFAFMPVTLSDGSTRQTPVLTLGRGDEYGRAIARIYKHDRALRIEYDHSGGKQYFIELGEDGIKIEPFIWRGTEDEYNALSDEEKNAQMLSILV